MRHTTTVMVLTCYLFLLLTFASGTWASPKAPQQRPLIIREKLETSNSRMIRFPSVKIYGVVTKLRNQVAPQVRYQEPHTGNVISVTKESIRIDSPPLFISASDEGTLKLRKLPKNSGLVCSDSLNRLFQDMGCIGRWDLRLTDLCVLLSSNSATMARFRKDAIHLLKDILPPYPLINNGLIVCVEIAPAVTSARSLSPRPAETSMGAWSVLGHSEAKSPTPSVPSRKRLYCGFVKRRRRAGIFFSTIAAYGAVDDDQLLVDYEVVIDDGRHRVLVTESSIKARETPIDCLLQEDTGVLNIVERSGQQGLRPLIFGFSLVTQKTYRLEPSEKIPIGAFVCMILSDDPAAASRLYAEAPEMLTKGHAISEISNSILMVCAQIVKSNIPPPCGVKQEQSNRKGNGNYSALPHSSNEAVHNEPGDTAIVVKQADSLDGPIDNQQDPIDFVEFSYQIPPSQYFVEPVAHSNVETSRISNAFKEYSEDIILFNGDRNEEDFRGEPESSKVDV